MSPLPRARITTALAAVVLALTLAACGADTETPQETPTGQATEAPPTAEATPTPEETVPEVAAGDVVTEEQAELLPEGQVAYPLDSGDLVVVDVSEPLPEVLVEETLATATEIQSENTTYTSRTEEVYNRSNRIASETGRHVIFVAEYGFYGTDGSLESTHWNIVATGEAQTIARADMDEYWARNGSREDAIAFAEEVLGQVSEPDSYQIIVIE